MAVIVVQVKNLLSVVLPCHNEARNLARLVEALDEIAPELGCDLELIMVNDGSRDETLLVAKGLAADDPRIKVLSFSRNFGKEAAMLAGLRVARGDAVAIMDADLQHPPEVLVQMYRRYLETGADQVVARRSREGDPWLRTRLSRLYYRLVDSLVDVKLDDGVGDFRVLSRRAVDALVSLSERNRFSKGLFAWIGYTPEIVEYRNVSREAGSSSWTMRSLFDYGIDGVVSFNNKPLRLALWSGVVALLIGLAYVVVLFVAWLRHGVQMPGYLTTIGAIVLFGGTQLICVGVMGEYVARIYDEVKQRPHYLVADTANLGHARPEDPDAPARRPHLDED